MKLPPSTVAPESRPPQSSNSNSKKTRELPNLSDCNCCNRRISSLNPNNKLGILSSEWRIVLLCKGCYNLVQSSKLCSYCLTRVSSEFYDCKKCRRRIHKDCVSKFSFGFSGSCCDEFSVCFDCWLPKLLENEYNRSRIDRSKKQLGKNGVEFTSLAGSGLCNLQEKRKGLGNVGNTANVFADRPVVFALEARDKDLPNVMPTKKGKKLGSGALGIVSTDKGGKDARLAIRLHREMNSSRRVSRNLCSLNTHIVDVPEENGLESQGAIGTSCSDMERSCLVGQKREILSGGGEECGDKFGREPNGKGNGEARDCVITYIRKGRVSKVGKRKGEHSCPLKVYRRKTSQVVKMEVGQCTSQVVKMEECTSPAVNMEVGQCSSQVLKVEAVQCTKTYIRKRLQCKNKFVNNSLNLENGNLGLNASVTCHEEPKALANGT